MQPPPPEQEPRKRPYRCPDWLKTGAQVFGTVGALVAAGFIYQQWQTQIETLKIDQRAWVSAEVGDKSGHFFIGIHNNGKTPALKVFYVAAFTPGNLGAVPPINFSNDPEYPVFTGNLPPDVVERLKKDGVIPDRPQTGLVVAPSKTEIASFFGSPINQIIGIPPDNKRMYILGRFRYEDVFGRKHETRFCYWVASPTDFPMCLDRNYMD
jgi:hypothetical protein